MGTDDDITVDYNKKGYVTKVSGSDEITKKFAEIEPLISLHNQLGDDREKNSKLLKKAAESTTLPIVYDKSAGMVFTTIGADKKAETADDIAITFGKFGQLTGKIGLNAPNRFQYG